ncbi:hypothetical protein LEMLEM_LOCUS3455 [Lemmus lemmus]
MHVRTPCHLKGVQMIGLFVRKNKLPASLLRRPGSPERGAQGHGSQGPRTSGPRRARVQARTGALQPGPSSNSQHPEPGPGLHATPRPRARMSTQGQAQSRRSTL